MQAPGQPFFAQAGFRNRRTGQAFGTGKHHDYAALGQRLGQAPHKITAGPPPWYDPHEWDHGFLTHDGKFFDRHEAGKAVGSPAPLESYHYWAGVKGGLLKGEGPEWQGKPILDAKDFDDLERQAAIHEFGGLKDRKSAEDKAHGEYRKAKHLDGAAFHLRGMRAAQASGENDDAKKHGAMYALHMKELGHEPWDKVPDEVESKAKDGEDRVHRFKAHRSDALLLQGDESTQKSEKESKMAEKVLTPDQKLQKFWDDKRAKEEAFAALRKAASIVGQVLAKNAPPQTQPNGGGGQKAPSMPPGSGDSMQKYIPAGYRYPPTKPKDGGKEASPKPEPKDKPVEKAELCKECGELDGTHKSECKAAPAKKAEAPCNQGTCLSKAESGGMCAAHSAKAKERSLRDAPKLSKSDRLRKSAADAKEKARKFFDEDYKPSVGFVVPGK